LDTPVVRNSTGHTFELYVPVVIVGAGAAGLVAALTAADRGSEVLVLERDSLPRGSTALSAGLIPAAGTRWQNAAGIADSAEQMARDIMAKAHGEPDPAIVDHVAREAGRVLEWLADTHGLDFSVVDNFDYPGHSARRMHGLKLRSGEELIDTLRAACETTGIPIVCDARVTRIIADNDARVRGVAFVRPDGSEEEVGCDALILACNGFGGNKTLVAQHIRELSDALYFGHPGNQGDALIWGQALGARTRHLNGHQGHGSVAHPAGILISWATMTAGGFQVNALGQRFSDESRGYSEQAREVLRQPGGIAWSVFDGRIAEIARQFEDFRQALEIGAILQEDTMEALAGRMNVPAGDFLATCKAVDAAKANTQADPFGRTFRGVPQLEPPFHAVRVTGALFHTQGGLDIDTTARVRHENGHPLPNLFAAGGAACGVSGNEPSGYLSGNGLLTAVALGATAGREAAMLVANRP
jgi:fumarate reductase flavoprotein subunit